MSPISKLMSRRSVMLLLVSGILLGALAVTARRMGQICEDGTYCRDLSSIRQNLPTLQFQDSVSKGQSRIVPSRPYDPTCEGFPDTSNVLVVVRTSAHEAHSKIPAKLMANLKCAPEFLIFSDLDQKIGGFEVRDSLDNVMLEVQEDHSDFDIYHQQKSCLLNLETCYREEQDVHTAAGKLDKYKNIHMAEKTYKLRPGYDWYVFVESDTYVMWSTLVEWLKHLKPSAPNYLGSPVAMGGFIMAHGRPGYVLSQATMKKMFRGKVGVAEQFDERTTAACCGDVMFGVAVKELADLTVKSVWPTLNYEKPNTMPFGSMQWCEPLATLTDISDSEMFELHEFQKKIGLGEPVRVRDVYHHFVEPLLLKVREDWDNMSEDVYYLDQNDDHDYRHLSLAKTENLSAEEKKAHVSFDACRKACESNSQCFQYRYHHRVCSIGKTIKLGVPMKQETRMSDKWLSGWDLDKIKKWIEEHKCGEMNWPQGVNVA